MAWLCNSMYIYKYIMYKNNSILSKHFVPIHLICKHYFNGKEFCIPVFFGKLSWSQLCFLFLAHKRPLLIASCCLFQWLLQ